MIGAMIAGMKRGGRTAGVTKRHQSRKHHAFLDESRRPGRYLVTAVLIPSSQLTSVTREVQALFPKGNRRTHLSDEGPSERRRLLKAYASLNVEARVLVASHAKGDDEPARRACIAALLAHRKPWRIQMLVFDSRGPHRDRLDRQFIARTLRQELDDEDLRYTLRGSRNEPLLSLPDALGWAVGASGVWRQLVEPAITEIIEIGA